jgi:hypothetical protein
MAQNVSLARVSRRPRHPRRYAVGPYQVSGRALDPRKRGIQFGSPAPNGPSIFGERPGPYRSCALSLEVVGRFRRRFPCGHGGVQPALGAIHDTHLLRADGQAVRHDGPIQGWQPSG